MQVNGGRSKQRPYHYFLRLGFFFSVARFSFLLDFFAGLARFFALVLFVILRVFP